MLIRQAQPDAAFAQLDVNFKAFAIPRVDQAFAAPGQLPEGG